MWIWGGFRIRGLEGETNETVNMINPVPGHLATEAWLEAQIKDLQKQILQVQKRVVAMEETEVQKTKAR